MKSKSEETPNYSVSEAKRIIERDRNYPDPKYFEITFEIIIARGWHKEQAYF